MQRDVRVRRERVQAQVAEAQEGPAQAQGRAHTARRRHGQGHHEEGDWTGETLLKQMYLNSLKETLVRTDFASTHIICSLISSR